MFFHNLNLEVSPIDPDELLKNLLELAAMFRYADSEGSADGAIDAGRMIVIRLEDLDEWMRIGGWLPLRWSRAGAQRRP